MLAIRAYLAALVAATAFASTAVHAETAYPSKPVRLIVPFPPGGSADLIARAVAQQFFENTKQVMVIENRGGADTIIGMQAVKNAAPDGYTVGYVLGSALTMNPTLYSKLPYDPATDFVPVMVLANPGFALAVHPSVPAKSARELGALIKAKPQEYFYGHGNVVSKIAAVEFENAVGGKMTEVAYKGSAASLQALLAGDVKVLISPIDTVAPYIDTNRLRVLAVTGAQRSAAFPDIPTIAEGGTAMIPYDIWHGIVLPAHTPPDIVRKLNQELAKAARHPNVRSRVEPLGVDMAAGSPEDMARKVGDERAYWGKRIKEMGIQVD